jgi:(R,R)-butanediol dehydrogenase/meso-butanediol dehydrogenase/diacetyl reductase
VLQLRIHGPSDLRLDDIPAPVPGSRDVVVRIAACGICGTDLNFIRSGGMDVATNGPMALGHEMSGTVEAVGDAVDAIGVGDRVVVHPDGMGAGSIGTGSTEGGFSTHLLVRDAAAGSRIWRVPDALDLTTAALVEPVAVGMHAAARIDARPEDKVVIFGCGPIGLAAVASLVDQGYGMVIAVDPSESRLELARQLGASAAINPRQGDVWEAIGERHGSVPFMFGRTVGTDSYIDAAGAASVVVEFVAHAKPGADLTVVAMHEQDVPVSFLQVLTRELTIRGAIEYPEGFESAIDLLSRCDLSSIVTHRFPIDRYRDALDVLENSRECGKVLLTFPDA